MIIRIRRSGGFAGINQELGSIDTSALNDEDAGRIEGTLDALTDSEDGGPVGVDMFEYEIVSESGAGQRKSWTVIDDEDLERRPVRALKRLLEVLGSG